MVGILLDILYFVLILGTTIFIHELGHFIFAKRAGIYVYEFSLGMGPKIFSKKRKNDETTYAIRLIPLGGFVQMAGEEVEDDIKIPKDKKFQSKTWLQRFMAVISGVLFNFIFAIILLFTMGLIYGSPDDTPIIGDLEADYPAIEAGIEKNDLILSINDKDIDTWDDVLIMLELNSAGEVMTFEVKKENGSIESIDILPKKVISDEVEYYKIGVLPTYERNYGFVPAVKYSVHKTGSLFKTMGTIIKSLVTGDLSITRISGPVGIYGIVEDSVAAGFESILYLLAFLSINIGVINLLPIPAFDGGRIIFLLIEKIKGKPVNQRIENIVHAIGFMFLMALLILITYNDIIKLF